MLRISKVQRLRIEDEYFGAYDKMEIEFYKRDSKNSRKYKGVVALILIGENRMHVYMGDKHGINIKYLDVISVKKVERDIDCHIEEIVE